MAEILVVEGLTDAVFFQGLLEYLYLQDVEHVSSSIYGRERVPASVTGRLRNGSVLEVGFRYTEERPPGGISQIPSHVRALLDTQVLQFVVAADIDTRTPDQVVQSITQVVCTYFGVPALTASVNNNALKIEGVSITVIPMGLYQDPLMSQLGVSSHAIEDYLI